MPERITPAMASVAANEIRPPLVHTQWGWLLTTKSALVATALLLGLYNRLLLARNPELLPQDARRFSSSLRLEAALMLAILVFSAFLANSPPAISA
jgi:putative copper export protein